MTENPHLDIANDYTEHLSVSDYTSEVIMSALCQYECWIKEWMPDPLCIEIKTSNEVRNKWNIELKSTQVLLPFFYMQKKEMPLLQTKVRR